MNSLAAADLAAGIPLGRDDGTANSSSCDGAGAASEGAGRELAGDLASGQRQVLEMIAHGAALADVLTTLIRLLEAQSPGFVGSILVRDPEREQFTLGIAPSLPDAYIGALATVPISPPYLGPCGMAAHQGVDVLVADIASDDRWSAGWREMASGHGLRTCYAMPIFGSDGKVLGSFSIYLRESRNPEPANPQLMATVTHLASIAIERTQAGNALLVRTRQAELAAEIGAALAGGRTPGEQLQRCAEAIVRQLDAAVARIWTLDRPEGAPAADVLILRASAGLSTDLDGAHARIPVGSLEIGRIAAERRPHLTNEGLTDGDIGDLPWASQEGLVAFAGYPLLVDDRLVGVMALFARRPLSDDTLAVLASVAHMVATGIDRADQLLDVHAALDRERRHAGRLGGLAEAALAIASVLTLDDVLRVVTEQARRLVNAHLGVTSLTTEGSWAKAAFTASLSDKYAAYRDYAVPPRGSGIYTMVCETNRPLRLTQTELEAHPCWRGIGPEAGHHPPLRGLLAAPLVGRDGRNLGLVQLSDKVDGEFTAEDEAILVQLAHLASLVIQNVRLLAAEQGARASAEAAIAQRDTVLASVSHDLKNPLSVIKSQAQLLTRHLQREERPDRDRLVAGLKDVDETTVRMETLIDELVDVARLQAGQALRLEHQALNLLSLVRECVEEHQRSTERHTIRIDAAAGDLTGTWDRRRLQRVIDNLLSNAIKYSPDGGAIALRLAREDGWAVLTVCDQGVGIPAADLPRVFERFWRGGNVGVIAGTGIGLAGARQIIEQHGGTIAVASGDGATFTVRLPLNPPGTG